MISGYLKITGLNIYYEDYGEGEPIVLLHGNGQSINSFRNQIDFFKNHYRVLAFDSRNHGKSEKFLYDLDYNIMSEDLLHILDSLKIESVHVLGWSDGGITGLIFAANHGHRVKSLSIMGTNFDTNGLKFYVRAYINSAYFLTSVFKRFSKKIYNHNKLLRLMKEYPHIEINTLKKIQVPVLIIVGSRDFIKHDHTKELAEHIENARVHVIKGSNHFAPINRKQEFNLVIFKFIRNCECVSY